MIISKCKKCPYFKKADWSQGNLDQKLFGVAGFCMDSDNPYFNAFAQCYGRGISKHETIFSPKWCALRLNKEKE
jgi:hypothetical protein